MKRIIFIFIDGFGLGKPDTNNPLFSFGMPKLEEIVGGKLVESTHIIRDNVLVKGVDTQLGVSGLPQSATGQTSLLTGINAPSVLGYHLPAFPDTNLINIIKKFSVIKQLTDNKLSATFANAYTEAYFEKERQGKFTHSVTTHCVLAAGVPFRTVKELRKGEAVYWDITREHLYRSETIDMVTPEMAGGHLATISLTNDFVLYETFATDLIGHSGKTEDAEKILTILDEFIAGIYRCKSAETSIVICSDHGNIEDLSVGTHTTNQVPLIVLGPEAGKFNDITAIDQITPRIVELLISTVN